MIGLLLLWPGAAMAHGVDITATVQKAAIVQAVYSGGEPMSFAKVRIKGPDGKTHQVGNTDANGRFAFVPTGLGQWEVTAKDGMGHRCQISVQWGGAKTEETKAAPPPISQGQPMWVRVVWGVVAIWGLAGLGFWLAGRRKV